jgi:hypothetical protein
MTDHNDNHEQFQRASLPHNPSPMVMNAGLPMAMPPLTRQTTYSSLPPSPRYEDYDFSGKSGASIGVKEFEEALWRIGGLRRSSVSASAVPLHRDGLGLGTGRTQKRESSGDGQEGKNGDGEGLSMWDLLRDEVGVEDWDGWIVDGKWERIANFLAVPLAVEKVRSPLLQVTLG